MNPKRILELVRRLAMLRYFPANDDDFIDGMLVMVRDMCRSEAEVKWLVGRMTSGIYAEWPGPDEMRACFCSRYIPKDGINAYSRVYPDGIPPSRERLLELAPPPMKELASGDVESADGRGRVEAAVHILSRANSLTCGLGGPATEAEIRAAPYWLRKIDGHER